MIFTQAKSEIDREDQEYQDISNLYPPGSSGEETDVIENSQRLIASGRVGLNAVGGGEVQGANSGSTRQHQCKSYIYAIKNREKDATKGVRLTEQERLLLKGGKEKKRLLRRGVQDRTGDFTIPYISLSYAHTWLGSHPSEEFRPKVVHKAWGEVGEYVREYVHNNG